MFNSSISQNKVNDDKNRIRILSPNLPKINRVKKYYKKIDQNRIYSNFGPLVTKFESRLADYFGVTTNLISTCANATLALEGSIRTSNVESNAMWELPSWTFSATPTAALNARIKIKFVDCDLKSMRAIFSPDSKHVIDVLPFGASINFDQYFKKDLIIIDAAASFDALKNIGSVLLNKPPTIIILSFHATKILGLGEGGCVISNDENWIKRFRCWSNFGFDNERQSILLGNNAKMSEYHAAVGLATLDKWSIIRKKWQKQLERALKISKSEGIIVSESMQEGFISPYWFVDTRSEKIKHQLQSALDLNNIEFRNWWGSGCHQMKAFENIEQDELPNTDSLSKTTISLPFHLNLQKNDFHRIHTAIQQARNI